MNQNYYKLSINEYVEDEGTEEKIKIELASFLYTEKQKVISVLKELEKYLVPYSSFTVEFYTEDCYLFDSFSLPSTVALNLLMPAIKISGSLDNLRKEAKQTLESSISTFINPDLSYP